MSPHTSQPPGFPPRSTPEPNRVRSPNFSYPLRGVRQLGSVRAATVLPLSLYFPLLGGVVRAKERRDFFPAGRSRKNARRGAFRGLWRGPGVAVCTWRRIVEAHRKRCPRFVRSFLDGGGCSFRPLRRVLTSRVLPPPLAQVRADASDLKNSFWRVQCGCEFGVDGWKCSRAAENKRREEKRSVLCAVGCESRGPWSGLFLTVTTHADKSPNYSGPSRDRRC